MSLNPFVSWYELKAAEQLLLVSAAEKRGDTKAIKKHKREGLTYEKLSKGDI